MVAFIKVALVMVSLDSNKSTCCQTQGSESDPLGHTLGKKRTYYHPADLVVGEEKGEHTEAIIKDNKAITDQSKMALFISQDNSRKPSCVALNFGRF